MIENQKSIIAKLNSDLENFKNINKESNKSKIELSPFDKIKEENLKIKEECNKLKIEKILHNFPNFYDFLQNILIPFLLQISLLISVINKNILNLLQVILQIHKINLI